MRIFIIFIILFNSSNFVLAQTELDQRLGVISIKNTLEMLEPKLQGKEFINLTVTEGEERILIINIERKSNYHYIFSEPLDGSLNDFLSLAITVNKKNILTSTFYSKIEVVDGIKRLVQNGAIIAIQKIVNLEQLIELETLARSAIIVLSMNPKEIPLAHEKTTIIKRKG